MAIYCCWGWQGVARRQTTLKALLCCQTDGFWPHKKVVVFICVTIRKLSVLSNGQTFPLGGTNYGFV